MKRELHPDALFGFTVLTLILMGIYGLFVWIDANQTSKDIILFLWGLSAFGTYIHIIVDLYQYWVLYRD